MVSGNRCLFSNVQPATEVLRRKREQAHECSDGDGAAPGGVYVVDPTNPADSTRFGLTKDVDLDIPAFTRMGEEVMRMQPGMEAIAEELRKIDGFQIRQENVTKMTMGGGGEVRSSEEVVSVEDLPAPAGTYEPPPDYQKRDFDFSSMMRRSD